jgi:hypothetical protein
LGNKEGKGGGGGGGRKQIENMFIIKQVKTNVAQIYRKFRI